MEEREIAVRDELMRVEAERKKRVENVKGGREKDKIVKLRGIECRGLERLSNIQTA